MIGNYSKKEVKKRVMVIATVTHTYSISYAVKFKELL